VQNANRIVDDARDREIARFLGVSLSDCEVRAAAAPVPAELSGSTHSKMPEF
jgi:hypothetical protein